MKPSFLPFALPDIGEEEIAEVVDSLRSGWITTGPKAARFEDDFSAFMGGGVESIAVNSATAGLHLALEAIGVKEGDEVITTSLTFTATAEVIRYFGADPVIVDIDPDTLCISPQKIEEAITSRTVAIIPVHYGGMPCDMPAIMGIAHRHRLKVIEDAAHAIPSTMNGSLIGTLDSAATVFSFYATKTLATGEGGMLVTRDPKLAARARVMRLHGIDRGAFDRFTAERPSWYYEVVAPGFKYNLTDIAAAIGIHQLRKVQDFYQKRCRLAAAYDSAFKELPLILPPRPKTGDKHAWHLYVVQLADSAPITRDAFIQSLYDSGIGCSVHYVPLHLQPYWRDRYGLRPEDFPHTQRYYDRCVSLPLYTRMTDSDQQRIISAVAACISQQKIPHETRV